MHLAGITCLHNEPDLGAGAVADKVVVLFAPEWFRGVGQFYEDFAQLSDETVRDLLARAAEKK